MDTGSLGEAILEKWASQVGLIANKATNDKHGWDHFVCFPTTYDSTLKALDLDDRHTECILQVKATTTSKKTWPIKLSNLKRWIESPLPVFYLVINVSEDGEPTNAHVYHVWKEVIERVLKKLRIIDDDKKKKLNRIKMQLPINSAQKMSKLSGKELLKLLNKNIGDSKKQYTKEKYDIRKNAGYEYQDAGRINVEVAIPQDYQDKSDELLIDFALGLKEDVEFIKHKIVDKRFGKEVEIQSGEGGKITLPDLKPEGTAIFKFWTSDYRLKTEIKTEFYLPKGLDKKILKEKFKILYRAKYLRILTTPSQNNIDFNFTMLPSNEEVLLTDLKESIDFALFLSKAEGENVHMEVNHKNEIKTTGEFTVTSKFFDDQMTKQIQAINFSLNIIEHLKIKNEIDVKLGEIYTQFETLKFISELIKPKPTYMKLEFWTTEKIEFQKNSVVILPISIFLGDLLIAILISIKGVSDETGQIEDDKIFYEIESNDVFLETFRTTPRKGSKPLEILKNLYETLSSKFEEEDNFVAYLDQQNDSET